MLSAVGAIIVGGIVHVNVNVNAIVIDIDIQIEVGTITGTVGSGAHSIHMVKNVQELTARHRASQTQRVFPRDVISDPPASSPSGTASRPASSPSDTVSDSNPCHTRS